MSYDTFQLDKSFWPRGFADAVLGKAYLLLLFLENFFEFHEKSRPLHSASRYFQKIVEINAARPQN